MTIEELCECSADELEKMSDEQLLSYFKEHLTNTRPEMVQTRQATERRSSLETVYVSPSKQKALQFLAAEGLDMSFLNNRKKK